MEKRDNSNLYARDRAQFSWLHLAYVHLTVASRDVCGVPGQHDHPHAGRALKRVHRQPHGSLLFVYFAFAVLVVFAIRTHPSTSSHVETLRPVLFFGDWAASHLEHRFKFFLTEWDGSVRSIEIKRGGRLEKMYFVVPDWCRVHWKKTPVVEMR